MSTPRKGKGAPAASLLAKPAEPKIVDVVDETPGSTSPDPGTPVTLVTKEEHERLQREHREWLAKMAAETPAQAVEEDQKAAEDEAEVVHLPTPEEIKQREHEEAVGAYLHALYEMGPDEPVYTVGIRPPRPQFAGLVLEIGDVVPGAAFWPRLDSWVRAGIVVPKQLTKAAV